MNARAQIPEAGIVHGLSNSDYHALPSVSSSMLKTILRSPAHYHAAYLSGAERKEPTDSMVLGSLTHTLFLEPERFQEEYIVAPKWDARTTEGKRARDSFLAAAEGLTVVTTEQITKATAMADSMRRHAIYEAMSGGHAEASMFWTDAQTGMPCRIRPDYYIAPNDIWPTGLIIDVKSTDDARPEAFSRTCVNFGYDLSAAMYCDGFIEQYGTEAPPLFLLLVVERDAPHAVACYECSEEMLTKGKEKYRAALGLLSICRASDVWPAYSNDIQILNLPKWAQ